MLKKILSVMLVCVSFLAVSACGQKTATWQEQYDLGVRYLEEGNYEEAVIAFTAAIKIDPKQVPAYVGRGDAYLGSGEYDLAEQDFYTALELDSALNLSERLRAIEDGRNVQQLALLQEALRPIVEQLDIPFTVDAITLGESGIDVAKNAYLGRPYAYSNLMNDDADDTVYTCFGMNDMPIPEGYEEDEFGFFFGAPALGGGIYHIVIADPDFVCLGGLRVGGDGSTALAFFGLPEEAPIGELEWELENGTVLNYSGADSGEYSFRYQLGNCWTRVDVVGGTIHRIFLHEDG